MNKKIIGSLILTTAAPIVAVVSCGPTPISALGILNNKKEAAVARLKSFEAGKPDKDDTNHDSSLYSPIGESLTIAIGKIRNAKDANDVVANENTGKLNIKNHIKLYLASAAPNPILTELKTMSSLALAGNIFEMSSDQFFIEVRRALALEISKHNTLSGTTFVIDKLYAKIDSNNKLIIQYTTNKTLITKINIEATGFTLGKYTNVQLKTLIRMFANVNEYATLSAGTETLEYKLVFNNKTLKLNFTGDKWMLTDSTVNNGVATDITSELTGLTAIGSKMWSYIQTVLLKKVTTFDLVISASTGLPSSISPPTSIDVTAPII